jgi:hypothetical protein
LYGLLRENDLVQQLIPSAPAVLSWVRKLFGSADLLVFVREKKQLPRQDSNLDKENQNEFWCCVSFSAI